jgi:hypothetical protein
MNMARKTQSRMELRRQAEAANASPAATEKDGKKRARAKSTTKKPSGRGKSKVAERKRLMWAVFNGSMKEEGRFPYDQREMAEEKVGQLKLKSPKKIYFIQAIKETIVPVAKPAVAEAAAK